MIKNKFTTLNTIIVLIAVLMLMNACKSVQQPEGRSKKATQEEMQLLKTVIEQNPSIPSLSSKMRLTAQIDEKSFSVNATLKMQKDQLIRISIAPVLGIEVARIEIDQQQALILDRINHRYIQVPLSELTFLANGELNFYTLQALFFHKLFLPNTPEVTLNQQNAFHIEQQPVQWIIRPRQDHAVGCQYTTNLSGQITHSKLTYQQYALDWDYDEFKQIGEFKFPMQMHVAAQGTSKELKATFKLSKVEIGNTELTPTEIPKRYKQLSAEQLFILIMSMNS